MQFPAIPNLNRVKKPDFSVNYPLKTIEKRDRKVQGGGSEKTQGL
jgi:hypothetical protein